MKYQIIFIILFAFSIFFTSQNLVSQSGEVVINEIMYKSLKDFDTDDWIELYNPSDIDLNIGGWLLKDDKDSRHFAFPANTIIKKRDFLVIVESKNKFAKVHPGIENYFGSFTFGFGTEDMVRIYNSNLKLVDSVKYTSKSPWYPETDSLGPSLELISPELDNSKAQSWRPSYVMHGTPGRPNSATHAEDEVFDNVLLYIFPNPAFDSINIEFDTQVDGDVLIEVYDILGNKVKTILDHYMHSGFYNSFWDGLHESGNPTPAGIYIININTPTGSSNTKIVKSN
ncbi:MAG: lamin tail domain-containing protein [Desulfobulbaceae bacterium]|nr:lamin tail domain-containing protein [Candidatus Kapabacteria bacterium]MBS3999078.1 lamin tail domain-containing protein [Desulfobulbaceae bacterium]